MISAIIPAYNAERYLGAALRSVLQQTRPVDRIVVVDDGSTDRTQAIARQYPVEIVTVPHGGMPAALNAGLRHAGGDQFAFLDADDCWTPYKIARQCEVLDAHRDLDMVFGQVQQFVSPDLSREDQERLRCPDAPQRGLSTGTLLIRAAAFHRVGWFETTWRVGAFIDWYCRATELGLRSAELPVVLMQRRLHLGNLTVRERAASDDYARILRASLQRRRAAAQQDPQLPVRIEGAP